MSSAATSSTSVSKVKEGIETLDVYLTCCLRAKTFSLLGEPQVKISLHLRLIVAADSIHQPSPLLVEPSERYGVRSQLIFLVEAWVSPCAWLAVIREEK